MVRTRKRLQRLNVHGRGRRRFMALAASGVVGGLVLRLDKEAQGQVDERPRFVLYNHCNSLQTSHLNNSEVNSPTDFELNTFMSVFEPHKANLTVLQGMDCSPGGYLHGNASSALSCTERGTNTGAFGGGAGITDVLIGGPTFDQVIADHLHKDEPIRSLVLGHALDITDGNCTQGTIIGRDMNNPIYPTIDPLRAHELVFGVGGQNEVLIAMEQSYIDFVKDDIAVFQAQLPMAERQKVEQYLESVRELERTVAGGRSGACLEVPAQDFEDAEAGTTQNQPEYWRYMCDLAVAAMQCGATRQASMIHSSGCVHLRYTFDGRTANHHRDICHGEEGGDFNRKILQFHAENVVRIWEGLQAVPEGNGTMADNTLITWMSDGGGKHHGGRNQHNMIYLGNGNGAIQTGQWQRLGGDYALGCAHLTSMRAMGLELEEFGDGSDRVDRPVQEILA